MQSEVIFIKGNNVDQNHESIKINIKQSRAGCARPKGKQKKGVNFFTPF